MELSKAVRTGYYQALSGVISAPVYDAFAIPEQPGYPYVLISSQTSVQRTIKRCKAYDVTITIDIVTGSESQIGMSQAEDIAEEIENIVNPDTYVDLDITANGYRIGNTFRIGDGQITSRNDLYYVYRKLISYSHIVSKINN